jgi:geranylgeranyl pyrophosphate synthase
VNQRARRLEPQTLASLVDDALAPGQLARAAHVEDWPFATGPARATALPQALWDRALGDVARDILARPSRQFRGRLAELAYRLAGGAGAPPPALAAVVEIIHAGSLIVDDIEDGGRVRRGEPCVHLTHGLPQALNGGNWMYFWALQLVRRLEPSPLVRERLYGALADGMARCHLGQSIDLSLAARVWQLGRADVPRTVATSAMLKTGALMELAALLGAIVGGADAAREDALARFGRRLGLGLQMLDDFGNLASPGANPKALEDLRNGTPSWPWAVAAELLDDETFADLQGSARLVAEGGEAAAGLARGLAARLRVAVGTEGRRRASSYLARALDDLREAVGDAPELALVAREIARLEVSYG